MAREVTDFWAVWKEGFEWPQLFSHEGMARNKAEQIAKENVGQTVHLMRINSVGTVEYPTEARRSGLLCDLAV